MKSMKKIKIYLKNMKYKDAPIWIIIRERIKNIMFDIDRIMNMLDCNNSIEIWEEGIELAKNIKAINALIIGIH